MGWTDRGRTHQRAVDIGIYCSLQGSPTIGSEYFDIDESKFRLDGKVAKLLIAKKSTYRGAISVVGVGGECDQFFGCPCAGACDGAV